ncbi:MAG: chromosome segregation protein SMC [Alphaproteobacteria bacterium]|nr:chromosome segregation protein SMC [Alphaproteobacteria bacterium]
MLHFSKLRLHGFKSFVERTELEILPGLTGIVGPNGCGKSNLVEALRWVMGESSAKRMRGDGMEDVIFGGTERRPARNIAEVSILLDNSARTAPAAYNGESEIEIVRRIERDHGSAYTINGRHARARDVQILFADTVTGANSPALVSQGRVTQIINAKPLDRRLILEESAGISGLFARRHEAELRLKAADQNLVRIEDVLGGMETRLNALKRQSRQATKYRNLSAQIRQLEILIAIREWDEVEARIESLVQELAGIESQIAEKMAIVARLTKEQNVQANAMPTLRQREAEEAAALQAAMISLQRLEDAARHQAQLLADTTSQLDQTQRDLDHENAQITDGERLALRLDEEQKNILASESGDAAKLQDKTQARDALESKVVGLETRYEALMQSSAEVAARREALSHQIAQNLARIETIKAREQKAQDERAAMQDFAAGSQRLSAMEKQAQDLESAVVQAQQHKQKAQEAIEMAQGARDDARAALTQQEARMGQHRAEMALLQRLFDDGRQEGQAPVLESVKAKKGFERALSRALGDTLRASLDANAPMYWTARTMKNMPALPAGIRPMLEHVDAPQELHLALSQIGYTENDHFFADLFNELKPGQCIVSARGTYWRWDGLVVRAEAPDPHARYLEQKTHLQELAAQEKSLEAALAEAQKAADESARNNQACQQSLREAEVSLVQANAALAKMRDEIMALRNTLSLQEAEAARLADIIRTAGEDMATLSDVIRWDQERLAALEESARQQKAEDVEELRRLLQEARAQHQDAIRAFDTHEQERRTRQARAHAIADEKISLQNRLIRARERVRELQQRLESLQAKQVELNNAPQVQEADKQRLLDQIAQREGARARAAENLAQAETQLQSTAKALRQAEEEAGILREARAHAQATHAAVRERQDSLLRSIAERFECAPAALREHATDPDMDTSLDVLNSRREQFTREREALGPVNLRADEEAQALESEVSVLLSERNDLIQAIEELRGGIQKINREARERLLTAFETVNGHFQSLFVRLFGGGKAHLELIDSEDPLGAGLEIYAQPPGKTLQSLSLLSGGEQTLASIAVIFAMFLTNPSPICVLDEIDAPLDDANVDRVCDLLEDISARSQTRFLIITHHRLTMARMHRLYGVTMAEHGVSQLVSVDLQQSFEFLEAA